jgi:molybdopterin synthase catalytic subunit
MDNLQIHKGALDVKVITNSWFDKFKNQNYGAMITFVGVVRDEGGIDGLSFDIYTPLLQSWFDNWQTKSKTQNAVVLMAHSLGDVPLHESSFIAGICSPQRKVALRLIEEFVEDFKASAPIWKYDIKQNHRVWVAKRGKNLKHSGILN